MNALLVRPWEHDQGVHVLPVNMPLLAALMLDVPTGSGLEHSFVQRTRRVFGPDSYGGRELLVRGRHELHINRLKGRGERSPTDRLFISIHSSYDLDHLHVSIRATNDRFDLRRDGRPERVVQGPVGGGRVDRVSYRGGRAAGGWRGSFAGVPCASRGGFQRRTYPPPAMEHKRSRRLADLALSEEKVSAAAQRLRAL